MKEKVHTTAEDGMPMLPRCVACGSDVIACVESLGYACHDLKSQRTNKSRLTTWRRLMLVWQSYYVGTNTDDKYPGIISGPFQHAPTLTGKNHTLWQKRKGCWVRVRHLENRPA